MNTLFKARYALFLLTLLLWVPPELFAAQTVRMPLTIEYPFLQNLLVRKAFREPNETVTLINEGDGCVYLALSRPKVTEEQGFIRLELALTVRAGTPLGGECLLPIDWQGYLVLYQKPLLNHRTWQLSLTSHHSQLCDVNRRPVRVADTLWRLIESRVFAYLNTITIDLAPPVHNLKAFLLPLFPPQAQQQTQAMLDSLRTGEVAIRPEAVTVQILGDVHEVYRPEDTHFSTALRGQELDEVVAVWEQWDALLSYLVVTLGKDALTAEERQTLLDVLLETRYAFVENLGDQAVTHDFVRVQFVAAWKRLSSIFRNHFRLDVSEQRFGYLSFFTAADALAVLDGLGPTFGVEVSRNGLIRLARMLSDDPGVLRYGTAVNPDLQRLFELERGAGQKPGRQAPVPAPPTENGIIEEELPPPPPPAGPLSRIMDFFCAPLHAAAPLKKDDVRQWQVPDTNVEGYLHRVVALVQAQARTTLHEKSMPPSLQASFRLIMPAMAWQESCFRQFVPRNNTLTYLLSSNGSSVGLMQVNMRVWRGVYDLERLRWDIRYNTAAGCEIAVMYLKDYVMRDRTGDAQLDPHTLARLVYAMYHGGPAQHKKYLERERGGRFTDIDKLFWEKYERVAAGRWDLAAKCFPENDGS